MRLTSALLALWFVIQPMLVIAERPCPMETLDGLGCAVSEASCCCGPILGADGPGCPCALESPDESPAPEPSRVLQREELSRHLLPLPRLAIRPILRSASDAIEQLAQGRAVTAPSGRGSHDDRLAWFGISRT